MASVRWEKRFWGSTRGRIVALLRRTSRTVDELAAALDLTDNAVRAHIATLERDGIVEQRGMRRGASKPAFAYDLTPEAERLFPKAYGPVLAQFLTVVTERMGRDATDEMLRAVGARLATAHVDSGMPLDGRLDAAAHLLNDLGGLAESEVTEETAIIRGFSCPLALVAAEHPDVCHLAETLVSQVVGIPMHERCERGERPRCCFVGERARESVSARSD